MAAMVTTQKYDAEEGHIEDAKLKSDQMAQPDADYAGAVSKSDPTEIALVRKLDYRIMPTLWSMYFLNYVCSPFRIVGQILTCK